jgi:hypothetical protein
MLEVFLESSICFGDEPLIELSLADARLVARDKQNAMPLRIECKSDAPNTAIRPETKLFHIGEGGAFERIRFCRPSVGPRSRSATSIASKASWTFGERSSNSALKAG